MYRTLPFLLLGLLGPVIAAGCSSDDDASTPATVVAGAPLSVIDPAMVETTDGEMIVVGTLSNVTERTIEIVAADSSEGAAIFVSDDGEVVSPVLVEPDGDYRLAVNGVHLQLVDVPADLDTVEVTLELDIEDQFTFDAQLQQLDAFDGDTVESPVDVPVETAAVSVAGNALGTLGEVDESVGMAAPQVTGTSFDGSSVELLDEGTPTVIGFFAHWCPHCQEEVAELSDHFTETGTPDDVRVVAVSTAVRSDESNYPPSAWFDAAAWPTQVMVDDRDNTAATTYGLSAFPFWVVVDSDGAVVARVAGGIGSDQFDLLVDAARQGVAP